MTTTQPSGKQPSVAVGDVDGGYGSYQPSTGEIKLDRESIQKMPKEQRASIVRHEMAHKIETEHDLWKNSDTYLWNLWEQDKRHPLWDYMGELTGQAKFDNNQSPEIIADLYANHYPKGTFTAMSAFHGDGKESEYPIPKPLMNVLHQIEGHLGIWKKKQQRAPESRYTWYCDFLSRAGVTPRPFDEWQAMQPERYAIPEEPKPPEAQTRPHGWKLHLGVEPQHAETISTELKRLGVPHKVGHQGAQEGKDMTVYVGHRDKANEVAAHLDKNFGHLLKPASGDVLTDDTKMAGHVWGRFEADHPTWHQYGSQGIPYLHADMQNRTFGAKESRETLRDRSHKLLQKQFGSFYTGTPKKPEWLQDAERYPDAYTAARDAAEQPERYRVDESRGYIACDLDGTLARWEPSQGLWRIGEPIPEMVARVKAWLAAGRDVRIFTARVYGPDAESQRRLIDQWCQQYIGRTLPVTAQKDPSMYEFWDDRAIQVARNTGRPVGRFTQEGAPERYADPLPAPGSFDHETPSDPGYAYHATTLDRAEGIHHSGLQTHRPWHGTDQSAWPDRSTERRAYFTPVAAYAHSFTPEGGPPVLLRVPTDRHEFKREGTGDLYTTRPVHPRIIEALDHAGQWRPLRHFFAEPSRLLKQRPDTPERHSMTAAEVDDAVKDWQPPTAAQREAENYRAPKINLHGLTISIETPRGERRRPEWPPVAAHYGRILQTTGADDEHLDVFVADHPESELVYVVDQEHRGGRWDEHKAILGTLNREDAQRVYEDSYNDGRRATGITAMTVEQFKEWIKSGDTRHRIAPQVSRYTAEDDPDRYAARHKPQAGQRTFHFESAAPTGARKWTAEQEAQHPRDETGEFVEKDTPAADPKPKRPTAHEDTLVQHVANLHDAMQEQLGRGRQFLARHEGKPLWIPTGDHLRVSPDKQTIEHTDPQGRWVRADLAQLDHWAERANLQPFTGPEGILTTKENPDAGSTTISGRDRTSDRADPAPDEPADNQAVEGTGPAGPGEGRESPATGAAPRGRSAERLTGGLADQRPDSDFDPEALAQGTRVEREHTNDSAQAREIAKDHLTEDPKYYTKLAKMEDSNAGQLPDRDARQTGDQGSDEHPGATENLPSGGREVESTGPAGPGGGAPATGSPEAREAEPASPTEQPAGPPGLNRPHRPPDPEVPEADDSEPPEDLKAEWRERLKGQPTMPAQALDEQERTRVPQMQQQLADKQAALQAAKKDTAKTSRGPLPRRPGLEYKTPKPVDNLGKSYLHNARITGMHEGCKKIVLEELDRLVKTYGAIPGGIQVETMRGGRAVGSCSKGKLRPVSPEEADELWAKGKPIANMKVGPPTSKVGQYYFDDHTGVTIRFKVDGPRGGTTGWYGDKPEQFGVKYSFGGTSGMKTGRGQPHDTVVHEFGHALSFRAGWTHKQMGQPADTEVARIIKSNYAYENIGETIAEAFKYYDAGGRDPKVVKFLQDNVFSRLEPNG